jgi:hypothetical protein
MKDTITVTDVSGNKMVIDTEEKLQKYRRYLRCNERYDHHRGFRLDFPSSINLYHIGLKWYEDPYDTPIPNSLTVNQERDRVRDTITNEHQFKKYLINYAKDNLFPILFKRMATHHLLEYLGAIRKPSVQEFLSDQTREKIKRDIVEPWREKFGYFDENKVPIDKYGLPTDTPRNYYMLDFAYATGRWDGINPVEDIPEFTTEDIIENHLFYLNDEQKRNFDRINFLVQNDMLDKMTLEEQETFHQRQKDYLEPSVHVKEANELLEKHYKEKKHKRNLRTNFRAQELK